MDTALEQNIEEDVTDTVVEQSTEEDNGDEHSDTTQRSNRYELRNRNCLCTPVKFEANFIEFEEPLTYEEAMISE